MVGLIDRARGYLCRGTEVRSSDEEPTTGLGGLCIFPTRDVTSHLRPRR